MRTEATAQRHKQLTWTQLLQTAHEHHLGYIIQFREIVYPAIRLFTNQSYSVYKEAY